MTSASSPRASARYPSTSGMKTWLCGSGLAFRTGIDSRWNRSASSSPAPNHDHERQRAQAHPEERLVADDASELEGASLQPLGLLQLPELEQDVAEAARQPSLVRRAPAALCELDPLAQDRLGAGEVGGQCP